MLLTCDTVILTYLGSYKSLTEHSLVKSLKVKKQRDRMKVGYDREIPNEVRIGNSYVLENPFQEIDIDEFVLMYCPMWVEERRDEELYRMLEETLEECQERGRREIVLAYFQNHLGIPLNVGARVVIGTLMDRGRNRGKGGKYTIMFEDQSSLDYCLKYASEWTGEISKTSVTTEY